MRCVPYRVDPGDYGEPVALGLISWAIDGRTDISTSASAAGFLGGAVRNGGQRHHNIYAVNYDPFRSLLRLGLGLGLHFDWEWGTLDIDALGALVTEQKARSDEPKGDADLQAELGVWLGLDLVERLQVFAGPSVVFLHGDDDPDGFDHGLGWSNEPNRSGKRQAIWPTASLGLRWELNDGSRAKK